MSVFRTPEWRRFQEVFKFHKIGFDQGCMGHERCKPTTLFSSMATLLQLHGLHGQPFRPPENLKGKPLEYRIEASKRWAAWAPGLKLAIATAIQEHIQAVEYERAAKGLNLLTASSNLMSTFQSHILDFSHNDIKMQWQEVLRDPILIYVQSTCQRRLVFMPLEL